MSIIFSYRSLTLVISSFSQASAIESLGPGFAAGVGAGISGFSLPVAIFRFLSVILAELLGLSGWIPGYSTCFSSCLKIYQEHKIPLFDLPPSILQEIWQRAQLLPLLCDNERATESIIPTHLSGQLSSYPALASFLLSKRSGRDSFVFFHAATLLFIFLPSTTKSCPIIMQFGELNSFFLKKKQISSVCLVCLVKISIIWKKKVKELKLVIPTIWLENQNL